MKDADRITKLIEIDDNEKEYIRKVYLKYICESLFEIKNFVIAFSVNFGGVQEVCEEFQITMKVNMMSVSEEIEVLQ